jgi:DNA sulfur modification protein DndE
MQPPLETIRLSQQAKDRLIRLKALTGIEHWNVLCRWAYCISLREPGEGKITAPPSDSSVEMSWHTFAGDQSAVFIALTRCGSRAAGLQLYQESLSAFFRHHLHRGINILHRDRPDLSKLVGLVLTKG